MKKLLWFHSYQPNIYAAVEEQYRLEAKGWKAKIVTQRLTWGIRAKCFRYQIWLEGLK